MFSNQLGIVALSESHQEILLQKQVNLECVANRYHQKFWPQDHLDLQCSLNYDYSQGGFSWSGHKRLDIPLGENSVEEGARNRLGQWGHA